MAPELKHVCDIDVEVGPMRDLGPTPHGRRRIIPIHGGRAQGPRLAGEIIPGGADWQYVRSDGVVELEARYTMRTSDGIEIAVRNRGLRRAPAELMERLSRGEHVNGITCTFARCPSSRRRLALMIGSTTASLWPPPSACRTRCTSPSSRWCNAVDGGDTARSAPTESSEGTPATPDACFARWDWSGEDATQMLYPAHRSARR